MIFEFGKYAGTLLTPPGIIVVIGLLGLLLQIRWRWLGYAVTGAAIFALLALSSPLAGQRLLAGLEQQNAAIAPSVTAKELRQRAQAIVVLAGGRSESPPEYVGDTVNNLSLQRLRYGATLHRISKLPILVSGGAPFGEATSEAELITQVLKDEFGIGVRWVETKSRNTFENAEYSAKILSGAGIRQVLLVTHAFHMPRSRWAFEQFGVEVIPAPTAFTTLGRFERGPFGYLPAAYGLRRSNQALSERIGLLWYQWRYKPATPSKDEPTSTK